MDASTVMKAVQEWPLDERFEFLFLLWDHLINEGGPPEPSEELIAELDRRLANDDANPAAVRTWEQVAERVRRTQ